MGLAYGILAISLRLPREFTLHYIQPVGTVFVNGLKLVAMPLVLASLIVGIAKLNDLSKLSRIGGKTVLSYLCTTVLAVSLGLASANLISPGHLLPKGTQEQLMRQYSAEAARQGNQAQEVQTHGPLQPLVNMVPQNILAAAADNSQMLQVVLFALLFGWALLRVPEAKGQVVVQFFDGLNEVIIRLVGLIMWLAPVGVFALFAGMVVDVAGQDPTQAWELLSALGAYSLAVLVGLLLMAVGVYPLFIRLFTRVSIAHFYRSLRPAQLLAFGTSSSSATLPVTMECVEKKLGVSEKVSSFVLPLGATVNMDGTSLYQAVAAVFIAQALGMELSLGQQLLIVLTATLASIGSAGVPGAGIVMLVIVLEAIGVPSAGIALVLAPDRLLDMCRTVVNITGDAAVAVVVASSEGELAKS